MLAAMVCPRLLVTIPFFRRPDANHTMYAEPMSLDPGDREGRAADLGCVAWAQCSTRGRPSFADELRTSVAEGCCGSGRCTRPGRMMRSRFISARSIHVSLHPQRSSMQTGYHGVYVMQFYRQSYSTVSKVAICRMA